MSTPLLAGVELGGTKCVCIIGTGPDDIRMQVSVPTGTDSATTLRRIEHVLRNGVAVHGPFGALGIASFGPIDLARHSQRYGTITTTAKPGWRDTPVAASLRAVFPVALAVDTDVNGAALAEGRWGAAGGLANFAYVTVGTGVGVSLVVDGRPVHGFTHSELGHVRIARQTGDGWPGTCVYHGDCVEGLASGPALAARAGMPATEVPAGHPAWEAVAHALAQLLQFVVLSNAPQKILIGGGVATERPELLARVRALLMTSLGDYLDLESFVGPAGTYIVPPGLGAQAGPLGALALAADAV